MCSYIVEKARLVGTAKGPNSRWMRVDTANVYYDHPYEAQLDHALCVDFVCEADGGRERVARGISAAEVAGRLGVDEDTVYRWERGDVRVPDTRLGLGMSIGWLREFVAVLGLRLLEFIESMDA